MSTVNKRNSTRRCSCFTSLLVQLTFMIRGQVRILNNVKVSTENRNYSTDTNLCYWCSCCLITSRIKQTNNWPIAFSWVQTSVNMG